jgi:SAM-dependent methyltransferase
MVLIPVNEILKNLCMMIPAFRKLIGSRFMVLNDLPISDAIKRAYNQYDRYISSGVNFTGKTVMEIGPGNNALLPILCIAKGALKYFCVDKTPFLMKSIDARLYDDLMKTLSKEEQRRAHLAFHLRNGQCFLNHDVIPYIAPCNAESIQMPDCSIQIYLSTSVLEHVDDLESVFREMKRIVKPGGICCHQVDLRGHGSFRSDQLEILQYSPTVWRLMNSHRIGRINRKRSVEYKRLFTKYGFRLIKFHVTSRSDPGRLEEIRHRFWREFRDLPLDDLSILSFYCILQAE